MFEKHDWIKAITAFLLCAVLLGALLIGAKMADNYFLKGHVQDVVIHDLDSNLYSDDDFQTVIDLTLRDFQTQQYAGCSLFDLHYAGDQYSTKWTEKAREDYGYSKALVLCTSFRSSFISKFFGYCGAVDVVYDFEWIYAKKTENGNWEYITRGYW